MSKISNIKYPDGIGRLHGAVIMLLTAVLLSACDKKPATQYTADVLATQDTVRMEGKFYFNDGKYRVDLGADSAATILLVDDSAKISRLLVPLRKAYLEMNIDDDRSVSSNLFQGVRKAAAEMELRLVGIDTIDGRKCEKRRLSQDGNDKFTFWVSPDYPLPLKITRHTFYDRTLELSNIRNEQVSSDLFEIPEGYTAIGPDGRPIPPDKGLSEDSVTIISMKAPAKQVIRRGMKVEVELDTAVTVTVRFKNIGQVPARCSIAFYKGNRLLSDNEVGPQSHGEVTVKQIATSTKNTWKACADKFEAQGLEGQMVIELNQP